MQTENKKYEKSQHVEQFHSTKNEKVWPENECAPVSTEKRPPTCSNKTLDEIAYGEAPVNPLKCQSVLIRPTHTHTTITSERKNHDDRITTTQHDVIA